MDAAPNQTTAQQNNEHEHATCHRNQSLEVPQYFAKALHKSHYGQRGCYGGEEGDGALLAIFLQKVDIS